MKNQTQKEKELAVEIGLKHGLAMHDPIHKYHILNAMHEYANSIPKESQNRNGMLDNAEDFSKMGH